MIPLSSANTPHCRRGMATVGFSKAWQEWLNTEASLIWVIGGTCDFFLSEILSHQNVLSRHDSTYIFKDTLVPVLRITYRKPKLESPWETMMAEIDILIEAVRCGQILDIFERMAYRICSWIRCRWEKIGIKDDSKICDQQRRMEQKEARLEGKNGMRRLCYGVRRNDVKLN